jgi:hypothetical protein
MRLACYPRKEIRVISRSLKLSMKEQEMGMAQKENVQMSHPHLGSLTPVG